MKERLYKLINLCYHFGKDVDANPPLSLDDWKITGKVRQGVCDKVQAEMKTADYKFVRTVTSAILDYYEDIRKEPKDEQIN